MKKALPIGVSDFGDMITGNGYYVDNAGTEQPAGYLFEL